MVILETNPKSIVDLKNKILKEAERLFGKKNNNYSFNNIYIYQGGREKNYPYVTPIDKDGKVDMFLPNILLYMEHEKIKNISHECIHLLSIEEDIRSNFLEEGIAEYFSHKKIIKNKLNTRKQLEILNPNNKITESDDNYSKALKYIVQLEQMNNISVFKMIKEIRLYQPYFSKMQEKDFIRCGIKYDKKLLENLLKDFIY